ncbi:MAG: hypothetical protein HUK22_01865 [Thermoguttaceae bacterium]|nr:hypothetical protein [Thermoguttaceae bacterium]
MILNYISIFSAAIVIAICLKVINMKEPDIESLSEGETCLLGISLIVNVGLLVFAPIRFFYYFLVLNDNVFARGFGEWSGTALAIVMSLAALYALANAADWG